MLWFMMKNTYTQKDKNIIKCIVKRKRLSLDNIGCTTGSTLFYIHRKWKHMHCGGSMAYAVPFLCVAHAAALTLESVLYAYWSTCILQSQQFVMRCVRVISPLAMETVKPWLVLVRFCFDYVSCSYAVCCWATILCWMCIQSLCEFSSRPNFQQRECFFHFVQQRSRFNRRFIERTVRKQFFGFFPLKITIQNPITHNKRNANSCRMRKNGFFFFQNKMWLYFRWHSENNTKIVDWI